MESKKAKDLREIVKPKGLRGHSEFEKFEFMGNDYLIEVFERDSFSVKVFRKDNFTIKVCEDVCEDLPDGW